MNPSTGSFFTNPYFIAIISPTAVLLLGTLGKGIIRGGISRQIFYLGFDASLSALYAGMIYLYDAAAEVSSPRLMFLAAFAGFVGVASLLIGCLFINYPDPDEKPGATIEPSSPRNHKPEHAVAHH